MKLRTIYSSMGSQWHSRRSTLAKRQTNSWPSIYFHLQSIISSILTVFLDFTLVSPLYPPSLSQSRG
ncbi:hypothetical protein L2E82_39568 [Cichorium intybus]|uniref:Uncharacterized protein n=1 Tax=Cichorium intybus TaxID=13427 RepID=A0ACB9AI35_CICIN|nr:hypothetical protein L2E82_39568 [Cichorium intybus]